VLPSLLWPFDEKPVSPSGRPGLRVRRLRLDIEVPPEGEATGAAVQSALQNQVLPQALAAAESLLVARLGADIRVFIRRLSASWVIAEGEEPSLAAVWARDLADSVLALVSRRPIPPAGLLSEDLAVFASESQWHAVYLARLALDQPVPPWCFRSLLAQPDPWAQVSDSQPEEVSLLVACWEAMGVDEALRPSTCCQHSSRTAAIEPFACYQRLGIRQRAATADTDDRTKGWSISDTRACS
jgi:hypothetical protein